MIDEVNRVLATRQGRRATELRLHPAAAGWLVMRPSVLAGPVSNLPHFVDDTLPFFAWQLRDARGAVLKAGSLGMAAPGVAVETKSRSRGDRIGQLAVVLVICVLYAVGAWWLVNLIPVNWVRLVAGAVGALVLLLLGSSGISASLRKTKKS